MLSVPAQTWSGEGLAKSPPSGHQATYPEDGLQAGKITPLTWQVSPKLRLKNLGPSFEPFYSLGLCQVFLTRWSICSLSLSLEWPPSQPLASLYHSHCKLGHR